MTLNNKMFENMVGKGEKCWLTAFSPFPQGFFLYLRQKSSFELLLLLSAHAFNLAESKILSYC